MSSILNETNKNNTNISKATKKFYEMSEKAKAESFKIVANAYVHFKQRKFKNKILLPASFDMYSYFYMQNSAIANDETFIKFFNDTVKEMTKDKLKNIETKNIDNIFKTAKHSIEIFNKIKTHFNEMVLKNEKSKDNL